MHGRAVRIHKSGTRRNARLAAVGVCRVIPELHVAQQVAEGSDARGGGVEVDRADGRACGTAASTREPAHSCVRCRELVVDEHGHLAIGALEHTDAVRGARPDDATDGVARGGKDGELGAIQCLHVREVTGCMSRKRRYRKQCASGASSGNDACCVTHEISCRVKRPTDGCFISEVAASTRHRLLGDVSERSRRVLSQVADSSVTG